MIHDHEFEKSYWNNCCNTYAEETKQFVYGQYMQLPIQYHNFIAYNKSILDIGGGPVSMLLKTHGLKYGKVVDPIDYPSWTVERYKEKNIDVDVKGGEDVTETGYDEVWIYNCMQHAVDPQKIIENAKRAAPVLRIFEWINIPPHEGHPHMLTKNSLDEWIGQQGETAYLNSQGCIGMCYYGSFEHK